MRREENARRFYGEGWFVVERALSPDDLATLRRECGRLVAERDAEMDRLGVDTLDLCHRGRRYFLHGWATSAAVRRFLRSDRMVEVARAALGDTVYLLNEQYVVKAAERGLPFGWHQDSGFIPYPHRPYLTCWIPLDDVSAANGTVNLLPYDRATNDLIGYDGDDPGETLTAPAGSIVAFSSTVLHRTGPNTTDRPRRAFIAQYSAEPLLSEDGTRPRHLAEPLLLSGAVVGRAG
jgi:ectoine hydroxylase-related dioxygenase (phytanoyl-CoA dioxygenase family)